MISKCFKTKYRYSQRKAEDRGRKATEPGRLYPSTIKSLCKNIEIEKRRMQNGITYENKKSLNAKRQEALLISKLGPTLNNSREEHFAFKDFSFLSVFSFCVRLFQFRYFYIDF